MKVRGSGTIKRIQKRDLWSPRTVALIGHPSSGKTSLGDLVLQASRVTRQVGSVDSGTSLLDASVEARRHGQTLALSSAWFEHHGVDLQLVDTPGNASLAHEQRCAVHACMAAVVTVDAGQGVELGTRRALATASRTPTVVAVTKVERLSDLDALVAEIEEVAKQESAVAPRVVPLHLPVWDESGALQGLLDVRDERVLRYAADGSGAFSPEPVPRILEGALSAARERLAESVALTDDELLERYLEDLGLPDDVIREGLARAVGQGLLLPLVLTSASRRIGAVPLLDTLAELIPRKPMGELVKVRDAEGEVRSITASDGFVADVIAVQRDPQGEPVTLIRVCAGAPTRGSWWSSRSQGAGAGEVRVDKLYRLRGPRRATAPPAGVGAWVAARGALGLQPGDTLTDGAQLRVVGPPAPTPQEVRRVSLPTSSEPVLEALSDVVAADVGLELRRDAAHDATLLAATSEGHLQLAMERVQAVCGRRLELSLPPIAFREVPVRPVEGIDAMHILKGEHGLVSEYGRCEFALRPTTPGLAPTFVDTLSTDDEDLPGRYRPAIDEGARRAFQHGPTAGYPVVGVEVRLTGGDYDILQSTDDHFRKAGEKAAQLALRASGTTLLEPWREVRVEVPEECLRALLGDIASHRGRVVDMCVEGSKAQVVAHCPYRELRTFPSRLEDLAAGRGSFRSEDSHYDALPSHLVAEAVKGSPFR